MSLHSRIASAIERARLVDLFTVQAEDDYIFFMDDRHLGAVSVGMPLPSGSGRAVEAIKAILQADVPAGTLFFVF